MANDAETNALSKLRSLRDGKLAAIQKHESEITHRTREVELLRFAIAALDEAINAVEGIKPDTGTPPLPNLKVNGQHAPANYARTGLQDAVLDIVNKFGTPPGLVVTEILQRLKDSGYVTGATEMYSSVYTTCSRLQRKGRITGSERDGKKSFIRKL
jgi:hypothetical protein